MDREQIRRRWEALKSAWAALKGPEAFLGEHFAHEDDVQAALEAVENDVDALLAAIDELEDERDTATRYLGQALTCAIHGLDEMNWKDVEDWLRRDEPASPYYRPCETVRAAADG
jgi:hypothetical protein